MFDSLAVAPERRGAIMPVNGYVEGMMCPAKIGGHHVRIIEVGQRRLGMGGPRVEDALREAS